MAFEIFISDRTSVAALGSKGPNTVFCFLAVCSSIILETDVESSVITTVLQMVLGRFEGCRQRKTLDVNFYIKSNSVK